MQLAVASANPRNVEFMGEVGGRVLLGGTPDRVSETFAALVRGARTAGRGASRNQIWLSYVLHVADTTEEATSGFKEGAIAEFYEFQVDVNGRPAPDVSRDEWYRGYLEQHLVGSPEDVSRRIEAIEARAGGIGGIIFMSRDWAGVDAARRSWEIFAEEVVPRLS